MPAKAVTGTARSTVFLGDSADWSAEYYSVRLLLEAASTTGRTGGIKNEEINRQMKNKIVTFLWMGRIWMDNRGQDLIEYALMSGFVAVAAVASVPGLSSYVSTIFSKVASVMGGAAGTGS